MPFTLDPSGLTLDHCVCLGVAFLNSLRAAKTVAVRSHVRVSGGFVVAMFSGGINRYNGAIC